MNPMRATMSKDDVVDFFAAGRKAQLPEYIFRKDFLPFFCQETPQDHYSLYVHKWLSVVGGPSYETELLDSMGAVTIVVPPMYNTMSDFTKMDTNPNTTFEASINHHIRLKDNQPHQADAFLYNRLMTKFKEEPKPGINLVHQQKWVNFYNYFNRPDLAQRIINEMNGHRSPLGSTGLEMEFD